MQRLFYWQVRRTDEWIQRQGRELVGVVFALFNATLAQWCLLHESAPRMHTLCLQNITINTSTHSVNIRRSLKVVATAVFLVETQITHFTSFGNPPDRGTS